MVARGAGDGWGCVIHNMPTGLDGVREGAKARTKARGVVWCVACVTRETDEKVCDNVL